MAVDTRTAPSLKDIVQFEIDAILRRQHLNRDVIIGLIGDRGDGKSLGGAVISIVDYALQGETIWSNMDINVSFEIDDETAWQYGFDKGGIVTFESEPLDIPLLLSNTDESMVYSGGCILIDEINIALADARRSSSNQNLAAADFAQLIRKLKSALVFTCIHEMFVDLRIRDTTDAFIQTRDVALSPEGLATRAKQGKEFAWTVYPMTRKLTGERYSETGQTINGFTLNGGNWWGIYDTNQRQERKKIRPAMTANLSVGENQVVRQYKRDLGWMDIIAREICSDERPYIPASEIYNSPLVLSHGMGKGAVSHVLRETYGIFTTERRVDGVKGTVYIRPEPSKLGLLSEKSPDGTA